jgi:hypothetical protein
VLMSNSRCGAAAAAFTVLTSSTISAAKIPTCRNRISTTPRLRSSAHCR